MIDKIQTIYSCTERKGAISLLLGAVLGAMVFLEGFKRYVYQKLPVITKIQSTIIFTVIYIIIAPLTFLLFLLSSQWTSQKKDSFYNEARNSKHANHRKMY